MYPSHSDHTFLSMCKKSCALLRTYIFILRYVHYRCQIYLFALKTAETTQNNCRRAGNKLHPSHSPEEVKRIKEECLAELRRMIEEFDNDQHEQGDYRQNIVQENKSPWLKNIIHSMYNEKY